MYLYSGGVQALLMSHLFSKCRYCAFSLHRSVVWEAFMWPMKYYAHRKNHLSLISKAWIYQVPPLLLCFVIMMGIQMRLKSWGKFSLTSLWPVGLSFFAPLAFMMWSTICMAGAERNVDLNSKTESQVVVSIQGMRKPGTKVAGQGGLKFLESAKYWNKVMLFCLPLLLGLSTVWELQTEAVGE